MDNKHVCNKCQKEAQLKCGGCQSVFYCSKEHQKLDWKHHKKSCQPFVVTADNIIGRHLIATRNLEANEIVLKERPLIFGPSQDTVPVCLGCCQEITEEHNVPCSKCGWPLCSEDCEKKLNHFPECSYTASRGEKICIANIGVVHPFYQCIIVLRCLYQKKQNPEIWNKLLALQSHCEERKNTEKYKQERITIAQFILRFFQLESEFCEDEIMKVCGIVMVNAHEVPLSDPPYIAIYEKTSMFENDCKSNCSKSFTNQGEILIVSGTAVKKGDHLSICYADPLWNTINRRNFLNETKFFWCACRRCSDPTEFGTYFSAVKCQNGSCSGLLLPNSFINLQEKTQKWPCNKCDYTVQHALVTTLLEKIGADLNDLEKDDSIACRKFINKLDKILPPYNFYLTDVKLALGQLIGQESGMTDVANDQLELKRQLCQDLVDLTKLLVPSEKRVRGLLHFELHASLAELGRRRSLSFSGGHDIALVLKESREHLLECIELLKFEPEILPEGKIYQQALRNLQDLNQLLRKQRL